MPSDRPNDAVATFAEEVRQGLTRTGQKTLPCKYLYDEVGSALFEVISVLPEYGLTRADERILCRNAHSIAERLTPPLIVAELGSGTGRKTRWILEALAGRQPVLYHPIEISRAALLRCEHELDHLPNVKVEGFEAGYLEGLRRVTGCRPPGQHLLVLFLGSSIGNFDRGPAIEFLKRVRLELEPGDGLLLGTDLQKSEAQLVLAYDDPAGVTAAFNLNLLARINRELGGDFVLSRFRHLARYDARERRIEMHLESVAAQTVTIRKAGLTVCLENHETLWTESCHKYDPHDVADLAARSGFRCDGQWLDREWPFAESLLVPA